MNHGNGMLKIALSEIPDTVPIGFKIPGIHWRIEDPKRPRISEMTCGLINSESLNGQVAYFNSLKKGLLKTIFNNTHLPYCLACSVLNTLYI